MLTRKPSYTKDDAKDGNPLYFAEGNPSAFAVVPPTPNSGDDWEDRDRESCRLVSVSLSAYLDGELDPEQTQLINKHLNQCADCAAMLQAMEETDEIIEREWREGAPLPSSSQFRHSIDDIMDALPTAQAETPVFAPKRVHSRTRWMRFATGMSGVILFGGMLWSSYRLGYSQGRQSTLNPSPTAPAGSRFPVRPVSMFAFRSASLAPPLDDPLPSPPSSRKERRP